MRLLPLPLPLLLLLLLLGATAQNQEEDDKDPFRALSVSEHYAKYHPSVVQAFPNASYVNTIGFLTYANPKERKQFVKLHGGEKVVFEVPMRFRDTTTIDSITLIFRKPEEVDEVSENIKSVNGTTPYTWDFEPAFLTVKCHNPKTKEWKVWRGPHGNTQPGEPRAFNDPPVDDRRFAEVRPADKPVYDELRDAARWLGRIRCDMILVENMSPKSTGNLAAVHGLAVNYRPFLAPLDRTLDQVHIFTPGTKFAEPEWGQLLPRFGGGVDLSDGEVIENKAIYPKAQPLKMGDHHSEPFTPWLRINTGGLVVKLRARKLFAGCEFALGDSIFDAQKPIHAQRNIDGQIGELGQAVAFATLRPRNGSRSWMMRAWDVPVAGVLHVFPARSQNIRVPDPSSKSDQYSSSYVRLDIGEGFANIMAVRCRYYRDSYLDLPFVTPAEVATRPASAYDYNPPAEEKKKPSESSESSGSSESSSS